MHDSHGIRNCAYGRERKAEGLLVHLRTGVLKSPKECTGNFHGPFGEKQQDWDAGGRFRSTGECKETTGDLTVLGSPGAWAL